MKKLLPIFILIFAGFAFAQITSSTSIKEARPPEVVKAQDVIEKVVGDAGRNFKEALLALKDNRRPDAGEKFNKSVEVFLYSTLNTQKDQKLQNCYNQLIETIYRIEFPSDAQLPQIRSLSATCGWNIENQLADDIALYLCQCRQIRTKKTEFVS